MPYKPPELSLPVVIGSQIRRKDTGQDRSSVAEVTDFGECTVYYQYIYPARSEEFSIAKDRLAHRFEMMP